MPDDAAANRRSPSLFHPEPAGEGAKLLLDLGPRDCRWPVGFVGGADQRHCGCRALPGKPYCSGHIKIAWTGEKVVTRDMDRNARKWG